MDESWSHPSLLSMTNITGLVLIPLLSPTDIEPLHTHNPPLRTFHPWAYTGVWAPILCSPFELATLIQMMDESWSCPSLLSMMNITGLISIPLPSPTDIEPLHMYNPPLRTFHPLSYCGHSMAASVPGRAHSSPLIHPRGVLLAWHRADTRQSAHCGNSSISPPFWSQFI